MKQIDLSFGFRIEMKRPEEIGTYIDTVVYSNIWATDICISTTVSLHNMYVSESNAP